MFKVTARDQGHYKGPSGAFVTYCNISCLLKKIVLMFHVNPLLVRIHMKNQVSFSLKNNENYL